MRLSLARPLPSVPNITVAMERSHVPALPRVGTLGSEYSQSQTSSSGPQLPPPPPPPPLPPPPPPPAASLPASDVHRRSMKKLNWDTLPSQRVLGKLNVWTSQRPQRNLVLDIQSMEELFSQVDKKASLKPSKTITGREGAAHHPEEPQVTILDSKKSMNIGIFLRQFKRPIGEMMQDICLGKWQRFGAGKLKELCKLLPEVTEVKQLLSFSGNLSLLPEADRFMVQLVQVPGYEELLKTMVLQEEFFPLMEEVKNAVAVMIKAANELLDCDDLHSVIRLVLKAGNYMNAGGYSANAIGFRMTSLLNLADTKANKPGMNLMHYVAKQAEGIDAELLTFPSQLEHIGSASRICKEEVTLDFDREVKKLKEVKLYTSRNPSLCLQMDTFLARADAKMAEVEVWLQDLRVLSHAVAEYFCEDPCTFKLEECCSIFHSFCKRFDTAVQENREREAAELRRKRKEHVRNAAKRRTAGQEPDSLHAELSLESALHSFLSSVPDGVARHRKNTQPSAEMSRSRRTSPDQVEVAEGASPAGPLEPRLSQTEPQNQRAQVTAAGGRREEHGAVRDPSAQTCPDGEAAEDKRPDSPAPLYTPHTPRPRTRDFFFAHNGDAGSPWTIVSPFACATRPANGRPRHQRRLSSLDAGDDLEGVWKTDDGAEPPRSSGPDLPMSPLEEPSAKSSPKAHSSKGLSSRSASVDETKSVPSGFRLGDLFSRSVSQRSFSTGSKSEYPKDRSRGEAPENAFGIISFFKRFGGRSKTVDADDATE
ncbi:FH2 domain containing 3 [Neosynchiropus ocellatus]